MVAALFLFYFQAFAFDQMQDQDFEKRIHNIYKNHYSDVVSDQEWSGFLNKVEDNNYDVRAGDTLWDLSQVFFGDGLYWSKLWSVNEEITNPHLIHVSAQIRFFSGSTTSPPGIQVSDQDKMQESIAVQPEPQFEAPPPEGMTPVKNSGGQASKTSANLYPGAPAIPPPMEYSRPVPPGLPTSFKDSSVEVNKYDQQGVSFDVRPPLVLTSRFVPPAFLFPGLFSTYPRTGKVIEIEDGEKMTGTHQYVYFNSDKNYSVGDEVTIMGKDFSFQKGLTFGDVIQYRGRAKVLDSLGGSRYRAQVTHSISPIRVESWITDEPLPDFSYDSSGRPKNIQSRVIGGAHEEDRLIFAEGEVVFLDQGSSSGLSQGDVLGIYKNREKRIDDVIVNESPRPIAHIKVFRADSSVASAFVFQSSEAVYVGDRTGAATLVSTESSESEKLDLDSIEGGLDFEEGARSSNDSGESLEQELESDIF